MELLSNIEFGHPHLLIYLPLVLLAVTVIAVSWMSRRQGMVVFFGKSSGRVYGRFRITCYLILLWLTACGLMLILCDPYSKTTLAHDIYEPMDVLLAVDISKSMLAESGEPPAVSTRSAGENYCPPTRLDGVAKEVLNFLEQIENAQTIRLALLVFARYAYPAIPVFTDDYQLFKRRFQKEMSIDSIFNVAEGSNHWYALEQALEVFREDSTSEKVLIILTDGEPQAPGNTIAVSKAKALRVLRQKKDVAIYLVGIGQPGVRKAIYANRLPNGCPDLSQGFVRQLGSEGQGPIMTSMTNLTALSNFAFEIGGQCIQSSTGAELAESLMEIITQKRHKIGVVNETRRYDLSKSIIIGLLIIQAVMVLLKTP